ncbi:hypothetical protein SAMN02745823_01076 [Sporobacter termitidis DSM 10068]|uniref:Uncharacterized protein n=1 Tax=Sporobacter termitidis DSM 10068 TaxID=1123282 RepID=A0A1M5W6F3_9FIRM|nr:hypothetical protein [Sporobacter termitidis]SHH82764.1 hypothetical protein SAMN02745823_01076 [Sporobacter termitidis DSM 10068]
MNKGNGKHDLTRSSKWLLRIFILLAVLPLLLIILISVWFVPHLGGFSISDFWTNEENLQLLQLRMPSISQAFGNLLLYFMVCTCGALLYSKRWEKSRKGYLVLAILSGVAAFFLHSMIWGVDLFIPSSYSLLSPYNRPLIIFPAIRVSLYGNGFLIDNLISIVIHLFAPQVLLAIIVSVLSIRKYIKT